MKIEIVKTVMISDMTAEELQALLTGKTFFEEAHQQAPGPDYEIVEMSEAD